MRYLVVIGGFESKMTFPIEMPDDIENREEEWEGVLDKLRGRFAELYRNTHPEWVDNIGDVDVIIYREEFSTKLGRTV